MKMLDWFYKIFYFLTVDRGSRFARASFLLWYPTSFIYMAFIFILLIIFKIHISRVLFLPTYVIVFIINFYWLEYKYVKRKRGERIITEKGKGSRSFVILCRIIAPLIFFSAMILSLAVMFYYGKYTGYYHPS